MSSLRVALTGAAGYIASHVAVALFERGHDVFGIDNFANSSPAALERVAEITDAEIVFAEIDVNDTAALQGFLADNRIDAVIHFAGLKAVGESVTDPLGYYRVNVAGSLSLLRAMAEAGTGGLVFSSSATVYEPDQQMPLVEGSRLGPINPYGRTKLIVEQMIADAVAARALTAINLRYFNPVGAHPSGRIGEDPIGVPNNLMPFIMQVAVGRRHELAVFGDDYPTPDGTCIRDYIHVCDLADAHVAAVEALDRVDGVETVNVGTGVGSSVREVLAAAERAADRPIPHRVAGRRSGDSAELVADPTRAYELLGWKASRDVAEACIDHWRWQQANPYGYTGENAGTEAG